MVYFATIYSGGELAEFRMRTKYPTPLHHKVIDECELFVVLNKYYSAFLDTNYIWQQLKL